MKVRFTSRARLDLIGIADYIRSRNPAAALAVRQAILGSLQTVALFPEIGRQQNLAGVRKFITRRYRYLVYYTVDREAEEILILTIQHPARRREYSDV
jgi:plasmid stabilization system protein ParE